MLPNLSRPQSR